MFGSVFIWTYATFVPIAYLGEPFSFYFFYYWGKRIASNMNWNFRFISPMWISMTLLTAGIIRGGLVFVLPELIGYGAAHLYFFIHDVLNLQYERSFLCLSSDINSFLLEHL